VKRIPDPTKSIAEAKKRLVARLARASGDELRRSGRQASLLTWDELIDLFVKRLVLRLPRKGTLAHFFMMNGRKFGHCLDRILNTIRRRSRSNKKTKCRT
jgi:hypothetical protein